MRTRKRVSKGTTSGGRRRKTREAHKKLPKFSKRDWTREYTSTGTRRWSYMGGLCFDKCRKSYSQKGVSQKKADTICRKLCASKNGIAKQRKLAEYFSKN